MSISRLFARVVVTAGAILLTAACATEPAADTADAVVADSEAALNAPGVAENGVADEVICREELRTGTNFKRRVCKTESEWAAEGRGQRREATEVVRTRTEREAVTGAAGGQTTGPPGATFP